MNTSSNSGSFAVDGAGQILRPGNRVHVLRTGFAEPESGTVVSLNRRCMAAEVDAGDGEHWEISISRLARIDEGADPVWVMGSL
jgi:hypothetical protein